MYYYAHPHLAGLILLLLLLFLIVVAIVWLVGRASEHTHRATALALTSAPPSAREILDRRLVSGEITIEEHEQLRKTISAEH